MMILLYRFAFALPKNGPFNNLINMVMGKMVESGELHKIRTKWAVSGLIRILVDVILLVSL